MKLLIVSVGKPKLDYAKRGAAEYLSRLARYLPVEWKQVKEGSREQEGGRLLTVSDGCLRVALDERGELVASKTLAVRFEKWEQHAGVKTVAFLIGGADGHAAAVRERADWLWSFSPLTLQHELTLTVLLEQLYRAQTIRRGEPYHRE
ncbi:MAG: 23S rRNA (pseudouridine(1915)-N(3))-methyltransferase RlmH [Verrucomicrobiales bacterium]|jgi:23S rRNA (pseudouridine1915-N3)-methyltransferase|nr:23S rRNA (pseudouridine(1915)-N(3))-methyltransferase RlmH [Verrucomicrobiales bacterium]